MILFLLLRIIILFLDYLDDDESESSHRHRHLNPVSIARLARFIHSSRATSYPKVEDILLMRTKQKVASVKWRCIFQTL
jgi:hypothetical protein